MKIIYPNIEKLLEFHSKIIKIWLEKWEWWKFLIFMMKRWEWFKKYNWVYKKW